MLSVLLSDHLIVGLNACTGDSDLRRRDCGGRRLQEVRPELDRR
jgi:hypothetical protein